MSVTEWAIYAIYMITICIYVYIKIRPFAFCPSKVQQILGKKRKGTGTWKILPVAMQIQVKKTSIYWNPFPNYRKTTSVQIPTPSNHNLNWESMTAHVAQDQKNSQVNPFMFSSAPIFTKSKPKKCQPPPNKGKHVSQLPVVFVKIYKIVRNEYHCSQLRCYVPLSLRFVARHQMEKVAKGKRVICKRQWLAFSEQVA